MRRSAIPEKTALAKLRPSSRTERRQLRVVGGYLALAVVVVAGIFFLKQKHRGDLDQNWKSATAVIEDVRPKLIEQVNSARGGTMLYEVAVLARYRSDDGEDRRRWITVEQQPKTLAEVELQAFRWKGQQCVVRWKPSRPDQVIAEVS
jgi:hypothetical protein